MVKRKVGSEGLEVSALGLGCLGMSQSYGSPDDQESIATIHRAIELGVTLFDTAEAYGPFKNEELLARALKGKRSEVIIATKFGWHIQDGRLEGVDSKPAHVRLQDGAQISRCGDTCQREQQGESPQQNCRDVYLLFSLPQWPPVTTSRDPEANLYNPRGTVVAGVRPLPGPTQFAVGRSA